MHVLQKVLVDALQERLDMTREELLRVMDSQEQTLAERLAKCAPNADGVCLWQCLIRLLQSGNEAQRCRSACAAVRWESSAQVRAKGGGQCVCVVCSDTDSVTTVCGLRSVMAAESGAGSLPLRQRLYDVFFITVRALDEEWDIQGRAH
jgi:hypothetical protein